MPSNQTGTSLTVASQAAGDVFSSTFDKQAKAIAVAPGRVNLIGEHIDYNDGIVLPFAIDRYLAIAGQSNSHGKIRLKSNLFKEVVELNLSEAIVPTSGSWTNYVAGVVAEFQKLGFQVNGFDAAIYSDIPLGAGLSSSAALEVAMATLIEALHQIQLERKHKAKLCQSAEWNFAGVPCGIMDQFAVVFGEHNKLVKIDCWTEEVELIPLNDFSDYVFVVANSNVQHALGEGAYSIRKSQANSALTKIGKSSFREVKLVDLEKTNLNDVEFRRASHVVSEIYRTLQTVDLALGGNWGLAGELMFSSHASLRDDYEVSCVELDALVDISKKYVGAGGVIGSRMTGGGFGGSTISIVRREKSAAFVEFLKLEYQAATNKSPDVFTTSPARGTHLL